MTYRKVKSELFLYYIGITLSIKATYISRIPRCRGSVKQCRLPTLGWQSTLTKTYKRPTGKGCDRVVLRNWGRRVLPFYDTAWCEDVPLCTVGNYILERTVQGTTVFVRDKGSSRESLSPFTFLVCWGPTVNGSSASTTTHHGPNIKSRPIEVSQTKKVRGPCVTNTDITSEIGEQGKINSLNSVKRKVVLHPNTKIRTRRNGGEVHMERKSSMNHIVSPKLVSSSWWPSRTHIIIYNPKQYPKQSP